MNAATRGGGDYPDVRWQPGGDSAGVYVHVPGDGSWHRADLPYGWYSQEHPPRGAVRLIPAERAQDWRHAVMELAERHYRWGHEAQARADDAGESDEWVQAAVHAEAYYYDLCGLVARLDPRPGAPTAPARPW